MNHLNTPKDVVEATISSAPSRVGRSPFKTICFGILAGIFIAIGSEASNLAIHSLTNIGTAKVIAGSIFPIGLIMIILVGGELFTGNCLLAMPLLDRKIRMRELLKQWALVYLGNLIGSILIACLVYTSGQLNTSSGLLGAFTLKTAVAKVSLSPLNGFTSGILCNIIVCIAILMASAAKDVTGKMLAAFLPIFAFVISGFEHCVANMYYINAGLLCKMNSQYVSLAKEHYGITDKALDSLSITGSLNNFIPVTLGNIVGGSIFVGAFLYMLYRDKKAV